MIRDLVLISNGRVKLVAAFLNAPGLGLIAVGVVAPLVAPSAPAIAAAPARASAGLALPQWPLWLVAGLVLHGTAHYVLGYMKKPQP